MTALEIAKQLIQAVQDNGGQDIECLIETTDSENILYDTPVGELAIEHREGKKNPASIKFII